VRARRLRHRVAHLSRFLSVLPIVTVAAAALCAACGESVSPPPAWAPNVVLIIVDDLRKDAVSGLGPAPIETPNIDRLGDEGIWFDNAFVVQSVCKPSRASIFTGLYAHDHGVTSNVTDWNRRQRNVFGVLERLGYRIGFVGKWHLGGGTPPDWADRWVSFDGQGEYMDPVLDIDGRPVARRGHVTDLLTGYAIDYLRSVRDRRFFLVVSHKAAHAPFVPQERWRGAVDASSLALPPSVDDDLADQPAFLSERSAAGDVNSLRRQMEEYYELVLGVDESVGRVVDALQELGILDETLVILVGDNGYMLGEHGLLDKRVAYEESIRVPLAIRYPAWFTGGERTDRFALNIDIPATIEHAVTGTPKSFPSRFLGLRPEGLDRSLKLVADGADRPSFLYEYFRDPVFPVTPAMRAVRTRDYKYVHYDDPAQVEELYDLRADPYELQNLITDGRYSDALTMLREELDRLRQETGDR
jgi:N-acetylglucosamine-6-sulfatase